ncbi:hypothetical protein CEXT_194421 [Caerostris extrusa]|uniref:Uncharacterized protein n=1 Tax=Caerostris extrusa TaxID=172846 RepID=A0AAV4MNC8_CAEEX|nr:hypothetical protein CEXT_194421 [Caerostris extrusa]
MVTTASCFSVQSPSKGIRLTTNLNCQTIARKRSIRSDIATVSHGQCLDSFHPNAPAFCCEAKVEWRFSCDVAELVGVFYPLPPLYHPAMGTQLSPPFMEHPLLTHPDARGSEIGIVVSGGYLRFSLNEPPLKLTFCQIGFWDARASSGWRDLAVLASFSRKEGVDGNI